MRYLTITLGALVLAQLAGAHAQDSTDSDDFNRFTAERVFDIEYAGDPQISPDGKTIVYVRHSMDRMADMDRGDLWVIDIKSGTHRPLVTGGASAGAPRWSPDGSRLLYNTSANGKPELRVLYIDSGDSYSLAQLDYGAGGATWSPDGQTIAFTMFDPGKAPSFATPIAAPEGAKWSDPVKVFDDLTFRFDGQGYLKEGATHIFTLSADGGTPRQITEGEADFTSPEWLDNQTLLAVGNEAEDRDLDPLEAEIYAIDLSDRSRTVLTSRNGPDFNPTVSPDGQTIAYLGFDDEIKSYTQSRLYVMDRDGQNVRQLAADLDRSFGPLVWAPDSKKIYAQTENAGTIDVISVAMNSSVETMVSGMGGTSVTRPYASGSFSVSNTRRPVFAYTAGASDRPADVEIAGPRIETNRLTDLNGDILPYLDLAAIEEIHVPSSHDGLEIEAWVALPPGFTADGSFPMILEIHGGPNTMYSPFFSSEIQRYAAEGYVTVYANPRGSTGYGEAFAQEIDKAYPGYDYDDLMSVVDELVARDYVDPERLFVTGGSGGGILTAWIVTRTDRFAAAASIKPVINWMTMALAADIGVFVKKYWIGAEPWADPEAFLRLSPIRYVDQVVTPTLMMVGEEDFRTPAWEAEQFYTALKQRQIETALIRVPGSSHYIAARPSRLIAKTDNIMGWFAKFDPAKADSDEVSED